MGYNERVQNKPDDRSAPVPRENAYQPKLIKKLREMFPGCVILKNDSGYLQGVPDLSIFYGSRWAMLEVKKDANSPYEANQEYYLDLFDRMSFAARIDPSNEEEVLRALQYALESCGNTRLPRR
jgi:hypothetical protein